MAEVINLITYIYLRDRVIDEREILKLRIVSGGMYSIKET